MSTVATPMTTDEFLSLPDHDKFERWLVEGELRERPFVPSVRHSRTMPHIISALGNWCGKQPIPEPRLFAGGLCTRVRRTPDSVLGIDVAVLTAEQLALGSDDERFVDVAPLLAVEILSESDMVEDIQEKIEEHLNNGTRLVWLANPFQETITVFRPNSEPLLFSRSQMLVGDPELPGFSAPVADLFG